MKKVRPAINNLLLF